MARPKPLILTVLDGWGFSPAVEGNAIAAASKPTYDRLLREFPNTLIQTSGKAVGLPTGQMGNSEVGHMNIGAGRVIHMDVTRIDLMIEDGSFYANPIFMNSMKNARTHRLHLLGLCSDGGVHSLLTHLYALIRMARQQGVEQVFVHCFMDGRDTPPQSGAGFIQQIQKEMNAIGVGKIASISGRYYAMDRDKRWERVEQAFNAIVLGTGIKATDPVDAIKRSYEKGVTDEFVEPFTIVDGRNEPVGLIRDDDSVIFFNYRADRGREMTEALTSTTLEKPSRSVTPKNLNYVTMTQYDKKFTVPFMLPKETVNNILANVFAQLNWKNLRVAETEKYAHVTYFLNGGHEAPYRGEDRIMVPSPKVATYDLQPEMSAPELTDKAVAAINSGKYDLIILNYANPDMVGHTGNLAAAIKAVETVDAGLGRIAEAIQQADGALLVTADHGNCEMMRDPETGGPHTAHTTNPVPVVLLGARNRALAAEGRLADIAPTLLELMELPKPKEMTGASLLRGD